MNCPVRIEACAWIDGRNKHLARLLGLADADHALIKVARIWGWQTMETAKRGSPVVHAPEWVIENELGPCGVEALLKTGLAQQEPDGIYMSGTRKPGRIDWLLKNKLRGSSGGRPPKLEVPANLPPTEALDACATGDDGTESGQIDTPDAQVCTEHDTSKLQVSVNETPAEPQPNPLISDLLALETSSPSQKRKRTRPKREPVEIPIPADWAPNDTHARIAREEQVDIGRQAEMFRDHALTTSRVTADWDAAFRTWLRRANDFARAGPRGTQRHEPVRTIPKLG